MTVIVVTASRTLTDGALVRRELAARYPTVVAHGGARGGDLLATAAAHAIGADLRVFPAAWRVHRACRCRDLSPGSTCRYAGPRRNEEMLDWLELQDGPKLVLAFWDGSSRGTQGCLRSARRRGLPTDVVLF